MQNKKVTLNKIIGVAMVFLGGWIGGGLAEDQVMVASPSLPIVSGGKPMARIVVGKDAAPTVNFAARELQDYVRKSTGAELPIEDSLKDDGRTEIVLGEGSIAKGLVVDAAGLPRDGFKIKAVGKRLVILGRDDPKIDIDKMIDFYGWGYSNLERATVNGVYEFLERFAGVRWYLPLDIGEVVPKNTNLAVPADVDITDAPNKIGRYIPLAFGADDRDDPPPKKKADGKYHGGWVPGFEGDAQKDFNRRRNLFFMRMRSQTISIGGNHTMCYLISVKRFGKSHPEFFALRKDGTRMINFDQPLAAQHCFSNEEMIKVLIEDAKAYFRGDPPSSRGLPGWSAGWQSKWGKAFHLMQDDGFTPCICPGCTAAKIPGVEGRTAYSELLWSAFIKVANAVKDEFPNCLISVSPYTVTTVPPKQPWPKNMLVAPIAVAGPYSEFIPGLKEKEAESIGKWTAITGKERIAFWNYALKGGWEHGAFFSSPNICGSVPRAYASYYHRYADVGQGTYMYLMCHRFAFDHLSIYMFYKYHWNPKLDADKLLAEYYTLFYGPAAEPMGKFWDEVEAQFRKTLSKMVDTPLGPSATMQDEEDLWGDIYGRQVLDRWLRYFGEAREKASQSPDPVYGKRVAYMKRNVLDTIEEGLKAYEKDIADVKKVHISAPYAAVPPVIDGVLDDAAWKAAPPVELIDVDTHAKPKRGTKAKMLRDDKSLYFAVECQEDELDKMKANIVENDVGALWRDNGIEIFVYPENGKRHYYQFLFNHKGVWADCFIYGTKRSDFGWNSNCQAKVSANEKGYTLEMAMPFSAFNRHDKESATGAWRVNFIRKRTLAGQDDTIQQAEVQTWSPCIKREKGFCYPVAFGYLDMEKKK